VHTEAERVARRLGATYRERFTAFGLANVALHRLAALVRLHRGEAALAYLRTVDTTAIGALPVERRVTYWLDVAEAHRQAGQPAKSTTALLEAERIAPEEVRCRPSSHQLINNLTATRLGDRSAAIQALAQRAGLCP
jgi:hypothetical protein